MNKENHCYEYVSLTHRIKSNGKLEGPSKL